MGMAQLLPQVQAALQQLPVLAAQGAATHAVVVDLQQRVVGLERMCVRLQETMDVLVLRSAQGGAAGG